MNTNIPSPCGLTPEGFVLKLRRRSCGPCILCGKTPAGGSGLWFPGNPTDRQLVGTPLGKDRAVLYAICESCRKPGYLERVERVIRADIVEKN